MTDRLELAIAELTAAIRDELRAAEGQPGAPDRLLSIDEAAEALGVGRSRLYVEVANGSLRTVKVGRRRLVPSSAITDFASRPDGR